MNCCRRASARQQDTNAALWLGGYHPRWSPDDKQVLFETSFPTSWHNLSGIYLVTLDGSPPHEILADFFAQHYEQVMSAAWHPDGRRISVWAEPGFTYGEVGIPSFWTVPVAGGAAVKSKPVPEVAGQLGEVARGAATGSFGEDRTFTWAPSGNAIYFNRTFRGARYLWKMIINPPTLRATALERLTTGPGPDTDVAVSPDGERLALPLAPSAPRFGCFLSMPQAAGSPAQARR